MGDDTGGLLDEAIISIKHEGNAQLRDLGRNVLQHICHRSVFRPCISEFIWKGTNVRIHAGILKYLNHYLVIKSACQVAR